MVSESIPSYMSVVYAFTTRFSALELK